MFLNIISKTYIEITQLKIIGVRREVGDLLEVYDDSIDVASI